MKYMKSCFLVFISLLTYSQEKFSKEFRIVTDNDLYVSINKDRYYTSGIFIEYNYLVKHDNPKLSKKIIEWSLNQEIYTPINPTVSSKGDHDRPFAGYLYAGFGFKNIYKNSTILNFSSSIGAIGKNSFAEELQAFVHELYNFREIVGWKYQIQNAFAANFNVTFIKTLRVSNNNKFDFGLNTQANVGTVFTNLSYGFYSRFGFKKLQKISNSIGFNSNLNNSTTEFVNESESFFYVNPSLRAVLYDATLQGSFLNTSSLITKELNPFVLTVELGFRYIKNRFNFGYSINYYSNKSKGLRTTEINRYGTITLGYLFI